MSELSFEEKINIWKDKMKALFGEEVMESGTIEGKEPPYPAHLTIDERTIRHTAQWLGDDNPLYTDPSYAEKTKYGCFIAPPVILMGARYTTSHGPPEDELHGLSVFSNMFAGTLFDWYDVIPVETRFWTSLRHRELLEKKGARGRLIISNTEGFYWNQRGDLLGKARGHEIFIPMQSRTAHDTSRHGEQMLYEREVYKYTDEETAKIKNDLDSETKQGAEPLYWEDLNVGDSLPSIVMGPFHSQDQTGSRASFSADPFHLSLWQSIYKMYKNTNQSYLHPASLWPYTEGGRVEHEDPFLCRWRCIPAPFDYGAHRVCMGGRLMTDWIGDDGFLRRLYLDLRKFKYYGDTTWITGKIIEKYKVTEKGEAGKGGAQGEVEYAAVDVQLIGINQVGEQTINSKATAYLPSRELGPVELPIPHMARPPGIYHDPTPEYVPFPKFKHQEQLVSLAGKFEDAKV